MRHLVVALAAFVVPIVSAVPALAHTSVISTSIAENARIRSAPRTFTVEFSAPVGLAGVSLTDGNGASVPIVSQPTRQMTAQHTIMLPTLAPGSYTLAWRTIARDGHAMSGSLHFVVTGG